MAVSLTFRVAVSVFCTLGFVSDVFCCLYRSAPAPAYCLYPGAFVAQLTTLLFGRLPFASRNFSPWKKPPAVHVSRKEASMDGQPPGY